VTDAAIAVLKALDAEGAPGRIEAKRTYPRAHTFKIPRAEKIGDKDVALGVVDQLARARFIEPRFVGKNDARGLNPVMLDRFEYVITQEGKAFLAQLRADNDRTNGR
jgi:hypothetical protein